MSLSAVVGDELPANAGSRTGAESPSFLRRVGVDARSRRPRWPGVVAVVFLSVVLVFQLLLAQRVELAASERWRPIIATICAVAGCRVPLWHEPTAYTMLARDVQPAADDPGTLLVQASFRNDARWPQAWPVLQLELTDVNGMAVASRLVAPADYQPADMPQQPPLTPGQSASVEFRVREPARPIVAFNFDFH